MEKNKSGLKSVTSHADIIDFYPITPEYKLRGRSKYTSWLGVLLSLSLIVLLLVVLILDIIDLADRNDPQIVISRLSKATINDKMVVFTANATFQMSWNIFSLTYDTSPNDVYVINCVIRYIDPVTGNTMSQDFIVGTCDEKNFPYAAPPSIFYTRPGELLCFNQNQSFDVSEIYLQTGVREVLIQYYTGYDAGLDTKEVFPEDNDFQLNYLFWAVDPSNYTTPLSASYQGTSFGLVKDIQKSYQISLVTVDFVSDNGWIFESSNTQTVINIEKIDQDMATLDNKTFDLSVGIQGRPFLTITIVNGGNKIVYSRQYMKVFDIFGDITGYYAIILPIVGLIILPYLPYARLKMYEDTANEIYEFRRKKTDKEQKKLRKQKKKARGRKTTDVVAGTTTIQKPTYKRGLSRSVNSEIQNSPQNPNPDHLNLSEPQLMAAPHQSPTQVVSSAPQPKHKSGPIHITFFGWLKSKIRPKRKVKLLSQAVKEIEETMDMAMIMKRLRDMQHLKEFWLTEEQRILFEGLEKPMLEIKTDSQFQDRFRKSINWGSSYEGSRKTPEEAYENINGKEFLSDIDKQLLFYYKKGSYEL